MIDNIIRLQLNTNKQLLIKWAVLDMPGNETCKYKKEKFPKQGKF